MHSNYRVIVYLSALCLMLLWGGQRTAYAADKKAPEQGSLSCNAAAVDFEAGIPADWTVWRPNASPHIWQVTGKGSACDRYGWPVGQGNFAGTGVAACSGKTNHAVDNYLCTPALDLRTLSTATLSLTANYQRFGLPDQPAPDDAFELLVSTESTTGPFAVAWSTDNDFPNSAAFAVAGGGGTLTLALDKYVGQATTYICIHHRYGQMGFYAQVDDVSLSCQQATPTAVAVKSVTDNQADDREVASEHFVLLMPMVGVLGYQVYRRRRHADVWLNTTAG